MYSRHSIIKSVEFISEYNIAYRTDIAELIVLQAELVVIPGSTTTENNGRMSTTIEDSKARIEAWLRVKPIFLNGWITIQINLSNEINKVAIADNSTEYTSRKERT